ncbi:hypothetical protein H632_c579p0 [Helicosporidium sp. ATCC 50920]|nr:hypothetical protein H632_c579p0 [Helicosporidium sp. ATCC 50920]|eukprot:KDD75635.1 hypothetical protein H632_c579p0 [Helicosporidium sp. ATCC 50920]
MAKPPAAPVQTRRSKPTLKGAAPPPPQPVPRERRSRASVPPKPFSPSPIQSQPSKSKRARDTDRSSDASNPSPYARQVRRVRHQLSRLRQEQALVEAYATDGWKGASRERVRPVEELSRAERHIEHCKEVIRECVKYCDDAEGDRAIAAELFEEDGELAAEHIFCAKCQQGEDEEASADRACSRGLL